MTVLVADDAMFMRNIIKEIVNKIGYTVIAEATDGREAITLAKKWEPDIIIMDINMPGVNGLEAVKMIKKAKLNSYIIMCTTANERKTIIQCIKSGASDYIVKPINKERLVTSILSAKLRKEQIG